MLVSVAGLVAVLMPAHLLARSLTAQYGASSSAESRATTSPIRWIFTTTTIALRRDAVVDVRGRPLSQMSIVYTPATQSDERESDERTLSRR